MTDFLIGYAPNDKLLIYYINKVSFDVSAKKFFFSGKWPHGFYGMAGLGVSYYLEPEGRSLFLTGGLGICVNSHGSNYYGFGLAAGFGYEYAKHLQIEGGIIWGNPSHTWTQPAYEFDIPPEQYDVTEIIHFLSLRITLSVLIY